MNVGKDQVAGLLRLDQPQVWLAVVITVLALITYLPFVYLPPLPDDYLQAELGERLGTGSGWSALLADPLYRCRATSILLTALTLQLFGFAPVLFHLTSVLGHMVNALLVYGLGRSPLIGWRLSAVAAFVFAVRERHHEAVIWYAALPEILVFTFVLGSLLCWLKWLDSRHSRWLAGCSACFILALGSKESGVVLAALLPLVAVAHRAPRKHITFLGLACAVTAAGYFVASYLGRQDNQHFSDGTFSLRANILLTMMNSVARGLWIWGGISLVAIVWSRFREYRGPVIAGVCWLCITMLPYSFVTYMPRIPSRHHYMASVGMAFIVSAAFWILASQIRRRSVIALAAGLFLLHNWSYLWTYKQEQFRYRSRDIERVLELIAREPGKRVVNRCDEINPEELRRALRYRLRLTAEGLIVADSTPDAISYHCAPKRRM